MDVLLIDPNGGTFHFPVNPQEVSIRREKQFETLSLIRLGEVDFPGGERVREVSFSSFFPSEYHAGYCRYPDLPDPQEAMQKLSAIMSAGEPQRLLITETEVNALVLVTAHASTFKGGEPGDVYFDLACRTWREVRAYTTADLPGAGTAGTRAGTKRADLKKVPSRYAIRPGDTLWGIAKLQYGNGLRWKDIYAANRSTIGPDPNRIAVGQVLVMPA